MRKAIIIGENRVNSNLFKTTERKEWIGKRKGEEKCSIERESRERKKVMKGEWNGDFNVDYSLMIAFFEGCNCWLVVSPEQQGTQVDHSHQVVIFLSLFMGSGSLTLFPFTFSPFLSLTFPLSLSHTSLWTLESEVDLAYWNGTLHILLTFRLTTCCVDQFWRPILILLNPLPIALSLLPLFSSHSIFYFLSSSLSPSFSPLVLKDDDYNPLSLSLKNLHKYHLLPLSPYHQPFVSDIHIKSYFPPFLSFLFSLTVDLIWRTREKKEILSTSYHHTYSHHDWQGMFDTHQIYFPSTFPSSTIRLLLTSKFYLLQLSILGAVLCLTLAEHHHGGHSNAFRKQDVSTSLSLSLSPSLHLSIHLLIYQYLEWQK